MKRVDTVLVPATVANALAAERAQHLPNETGGFLLGARRGSTLEIVEFTPQGRGDVANHVSFERVDTQHQLRADKAWKAAKGLVGLVGDWHSHPTGLGSPSGQDRQAWRTLVATMNASAVGMIVVAGEVAVFGLWPSWRGLVVARLPLVIADGQDHVFGRLPESD